MLKNYLIVAFRALRKNTVYSVLNLVGLAVGMASCILIFMLVWHEWSFDRFHENAPDIYRTILSYRSPDGEQHYQTMMTPSFTDSFKESFPSVDRATPYVGNDVDLEVDGDTYRQALREVHSDFFSMFSFELLAGNRETLLDDPASMVITSVIADKLFGTEHDNARDALGRTVTITRNGVAYDFTISGVVDALPSNSSLSFDAAISFENYTNIRLGGNNWGGRVSTYVLLRPGTTARGMQAALSSFALTEFASYVSDMQAAENMAKGENSHELIMQPLTDLHRTPAIRVPYEAAVHNPLYSYILGGIGVLILLIACINFMTLSVGQSSRRAREVGMRKALGAHRVQLMKQFWGESLVVTTLALILGLSIAFMALPWFNSLTGNELSFTSLPSGTIFMVLLVLISVVGLVAGGYPAVVLSRFQAASVLKGDVASTGQNWLTKSLVVLQYTISIGLIVSTGIMSQQLQFMFNKDLGYEKELIVSVDTNQISRGDADGVLERMRSKLLAFDQIKLVSRAGSSFTRGSDRNGWADENGVNRQAYNFGVDYDYVDLMGMTIVEGRNFSREFATDPTNSILVNEALVREFGIEKPIGHIMSGWLTFLTDEPIQIIGVVKDYHFQSLHQEVQPAIMNMLPDYYNYMGAILIKIDGSDVSGTMETIERTWAEVVPGRPFTSSFLDEDVSNQYQTEQQWRAIVTYSSVLAILIACMGLFGLAILSVSRRTKEIGIRKVLGASVPHLAGLVAREFAVLVLVASVLASPMAYFGMESWLSDFAFHVSIGPSIFIFAATGALLIAMGTISVQAMRAATADPVQSLRTE